MGDLGVLSGLLHPAHQLGDVVRRQRRTPRKGRRRGIDEPDADEILFGVEAEVRVERHARRKRHLMQQHGIAVGRGAGGTAGGDHAAGAADVLDDDLLAERLRHAVLDDARDRIGRAAGRERHHERDRTAGIGLRCCSAGWEDRCGEKRRRAAEQRDELAPPHSISSSARPESGSGTVMPSVLAVLRLMSSSTFVACCTGRSAGFSPLRTLPT